MQAPKTRNECIRRILVAYIGVITSMIYNLSQTQRKRLRERIKPIFGLKNWGG